MARRADAERGMVSIASPWKHQAGQDLVEFALVLPILLSLLLAIIELGFVVLSWVSLDNAVREGARVGITCKDCDTAIQDAVTSHLVGLPPDLSFNGGKPYVTHPTAGTVRVEARSLHPLWAARFVGRPLGSLTIHLSAVAQMNTEY
jgi:Flp pilus assembly protein TadG